MVVLFCCQYFYLPCYSNENSQFITYKQCANINDKVCVSEWRFVTTTKELGSLLPVCKVRMRTIMKQYP